MDLFRVFNWNPKATGPSENGHPLFVWPQQGAGRLDDPQHEYLVLYTGSDPAAAVAEAFGRFVRWTPAILEPPPGHAPGTRKALAHYRGDPKVLDLDDPIALLDLGLRPSQVVERNRDATQQWARRIFNTGHYDGVSWWSFYNPQWSSIGLWNISALALVSTPTPLVLTDPVVEAAAAALGRIIGP